MFVICVVCAEHGGVRRECAERPELGVPLVILAGILIKKTVAESREILRIGRIS